MILTYKIWALQVLDIFKLFLITLICLHSCVLQDTDVEVKR